MPYLPIPAIDIFLLHEIEGDVGSIRSVVATQAEADKWTKKRMDKYIKKQTKNLHGAKYTIEHLSDGRICGWKYGNRQFVFEWRELETENSKKPIIHGSRVKVFMVGEFVHSDERRYELIFVVNTKNMH